MDYTIYAYYYINKAESFDKNLVKIATYHSEEVAERYLSELEEEAELKGEKPFPYSDADGFLIRPESKITIIDNLPNKLLNPGTADNRFVREYEMQEVILNLKFSRAARDCEIRSIEIPSLKMNIQGNKITFEYPGAYSKGESMAEEDSFEYILLLRNDYPHKVLKLIKSIEGVSCSASFSSWDADFRWTERSDAAILLIEEEEEE